MTMDCNKIIDSYLKWIKDNTEIKSIKDGQTCEITTPFLDRHNDHLQIYIVKQPNGNLLLTDDGYVMQDLTMSGVDMNTPKRLQLFQSTLNGFGAKKDDKDRIIIEANMYNIGQKKHSFIQALLAIDDMYTLGQENIASFFKEDVEQYFKLNNIFYTKDIKIPGKSGFDHSIDFLISATRTKPEQLIRTINKPKKDSIMATIFAFTDIQSIREQHTKNYVVYNDIDSPVHPEVISALNSYNVVGMPWSKKEILKQEFAIN
jgi:hypothetical protein